MNSKEESVHDVQVYSRQLTIPDDLNTVDKAEPYLRSKHPGIQIRLEGLMFGAFPHEKRIPYISLRVDGSGYIVGTTLFYLK